jgi:hypothetical protein
MSNLILTWKIAILWALSLVAVGALTSHAQVSPRRERPTELPTIVSGSNVGFRIDRTKDGLPSGRLVVQIEGKWIEPIQQ